MPIYEYECPKCGLFEVVQKASEKALKANPECSCKDCPRKAQRKISAAAFHLKGTGWYKTDYGSGKSAGTSKSASSSAATPASSSGSSDGGTGDKKADKTETKVEAKTDAGKDNKKAGCGSGCGCH